MLDKTHAFPAAVCPVDLSQLQESQDSMVCTAAGHRYARQQGIPRLLSSTSTYADGFGEQWQQYRVTQLDSYTGTTISADRLRRCLGEELWAKLQQPSQRLEILETGCGAGRFTEVLMKLPAAFVTSTDLSSAVEANQVNCPQSARHRIIQCDINQLPFQPGQYDVVVCLGVVQHTKNPERTIADLYAQVKPGGWLIIDHYAPSLSAYTKFTAMALRPLLKRTSPQFGVKATRAITRLFFPMHRAVKNVKPLQMVLSRISPLLTYYHALPQLNDRLQYEWAELDTHDSLTDYYKHLRSPRAIAATLAALHASNIWVAKGGNGVEARCQKPGARQDG
jgi:2-polyprenyl-3-methyl-5-hydroxy-6-metoxy-1,4-benzoquinol methylase